MTHNQFISVIIPAYNEEKNIDVCLSKITKFFGDVKAEIIIVLNGCTDNTSEIAQRAALEYLRGNSKITFKLLNSFKGKGAAVKTGVFNALGNYILITDADLSTPIYNVGLFLAELTRGRADVVIASRRLPGSIVEGRTNNRDLTSTAFNLFTRPLLPGITDSQCGFKMIKRAAAIEIFKRVTQQGFSFDVELLYIARRLGYKIKELPVIWTDSENGSTVKPIKDGLKMAGELVEIAGRAVNGGYD